MDGRVAHERSPPPAPPLAVGPAGPHSVAGWSASLPEEQYLLRGSPEDGWPCSLATLTCGSCLAVGFLDRLEASPLITGVEPGLEIRSDGNIARCHCLSGPWRPRAQANPAAHHVTQQDHPARDAAHPGCGL
jgi:hypothetical protein